MAEIFISHRNVPDPDHRLADFFLNYLTGLGHHVFIDELIGVGDEWPKTIQKNLNECQFFLVLLSDQAIASEMVREEIRRAHGRKKETGSPTILPIRVKTKTSLPLDLGAILDPIQYAFWNQDGDEHQIAISIKHAIDSNLPFEAVAQIHPPASNVAATDSAAVPMPLPSFDPHWIDQLRAPGGAVDLESPFYIERQSDPQAKKNVTANGQTLRIKGSRQMGKTSLLARLHSHARSEGHKSIYIDLQSLDAGQFVSLDVFLRSLANVVFSRLKTNESPGNYWNSDLGPKDKFSEFLACEVLQHAEKPVVLILDEVDRVFNYPNYRDDFFSLIRACHNRRAFESPWEMLNIVLAYSTEAFLFIADLNQSPFNVGIDFSLEDFSSTQIRQLNDQHGSPITTEQEMDLLRQLLGGHPYLIRQALYQMAMHQVLLNDLIAHACDDNGLFNDHLHRYLWWFNDHPQARTAMKAAIWDKACPTDLDFYRLRSAGLVQGSSRYSVVPRCGLYWKYFGEHL
jgi:hypothetical protein